MPGRRDINEEGLQFYTEFVLPPNKGIRKTMIRQVLKMFRSKYPSIDDAPPSAAAESPSIFESYVSSEPSKQNVLDIFKGEWSSCLPDKYGLRTSPGFANVFEHQLIDWAEKALGGFQGKTVLELGPLEGGHTYMLHQKGAKTIVSIEANSRAFLKCLCIKEVLDLTNVEFRLGDFMLYLEECNDRYDVALASGVLYHMMEPVTLLDNLSSISSRLLLWTHYYAPEIQLPQDQRRFGEIQVGNHNGFTYEYVQQFYNEALDWSGFSGGPKPQSIWLTRSSLLSCLEILGYTDIKIDFDHSDHPNGPALGICALKG